MTCNPSKYSESLGEKGQKSMKGGGGSLTHLIIEHEEIIVKYQDDCADADVLNLSSVLVLNSMLIAEQTSSVQLVTTD